MDGRVRFDVSAPVACEARRGPLWPPVLRKGHGHLVLRRRSSCLEAELMEMRSESSSDGVKFSEGEKISGLAVRELLRCLGDSDLANE